MPKNARKDSPGGAARPAAAERGPRANEVSASDVGSLALNREVQRIPRDLQTRGRA